MAGAKASGCPICGAPAVKGQGKAAPGDADPYPFCSTRCQLIDLGKWLGDEYRIPDRETVIFPPPSSGGDDDREG